MTHDEIIAALPKIARDLHKITDLVSDEQMTPPRNDGHWSIKQVIGHLRDTAEMYGGRLFRMAQEDQPQLAGYDQDAMVAAGNYNRRAVEPVIAEIAERDAAIVELLRGLDEAGWQRVGIHSERGPITIEFLANYYAEHGPLHLSDLWDRVGSC